MLLVLGSGFFFKDEILKFVSRAKNVEDLSKLVTKKSNVKIVKLRGSVSISKNDKAYYKIDKDEHLEVGDVLITSKKSSITVSFGFNFQNQFTLGPDSTLELNSLYSNEEGIKTGSEFKLLEGMITSELNNLEGVEYKIFTENTYFMTRESKFLVRKMENKDDILVVNKGVVEAFSLDSKEKSMAKKGEVYFFFTSGLRFPLSDPELTNKIQLGFDNQDKLDIETVYNVYSRIIGRIDKVKMILTIKERIIQMGKDTHTKINSNNSKLSKLLKKSEELTDDFRRAKKNAIEDAKCLRRQLNCLLKSESLLLRRGLVRTSGTKKYNKKSISSLRSYLLENKQKNSKVKESSRKLQSQVSRQKDWLVDIKKIEKLLYPEKGFVAPELVKEIVALNKKAKDKKLKRFMEMANWIVAIQVLE